MLQRITTPSHSHCNSSIKGIRKREKFKLRQLHLIWIGKDIFTFHNMISFLSQVQCQVRGVHLVHFVLTSCASKPFGRGNQKDVCPFVRFRFLLLLRSRCRLVVFSFFLFVFSYLFYPSIRYIMKCLQMSPNAPATLIASDVSSLGPAFVRFFDHKWISSSPPLDLCHFSLCLCWSHCSVCLSSFLSLSLSLSFSILLPFFCAFFSPTDLLHFVLDACYYNSTFDLLPLLSPFVSSNECTQTQSWKKGKGQPVLHQQGMQEVREDAASPACNWKSISLWLVRRIS